jgi:hypothetical protein
MNSTDEEAIRSTAFKVEYWHIDPNGDGMAGPFDTIEDAQKDALCILHDNRYRTGAIRIVKTVAISETKVSFDTKWLPRG